MIHIRGGTFMMGTEGVGPHIDNEQPPHQVTVASFEIDFTEVTVAAYRACIDAGACTPSGGPTNEMDGACNLRVPGTDQHPINCVTAFQAEDFCRWARKRLPTEEEWEFTSRGAKSRDFPWGNGLPDHDDFGLGPTPHLVNCPFPRVSGGPVVGTCPVTSAPGADTPEGVRGLARNVQEWTSSPYCPYSDPKCTTEERTVRGGSFKLMPGYSARGAARWGRKPASVWNYVGFRCARDAG